VRVLIVGFGYVGQALGRELAARGDHVLGIRRSVGEAMPDVEQCALDATQPGVFEALTGDFDAVVYAVAPGERSDAAYLSGYVMGLKELLGSSWVRRSAPRIVFVSSTAVYAESDGGWVDETSALTMEAFSARRLIEAEQLLQASGLPGVVLRFAGIYGPGRTRFVSSVLRGEVPGDDAVPRYMNRIHRDDCVGALLHLLDLPQPEALYLGVDDEPASRNSVVGWLRQNLGTESDRVPASGGGGSSREVGNKRCSNKKLRDSGYNFRFPSFREGYASVADEC